MLASIRLASLGIAVALLSGGCADDQGAKTSASATGGSGVILRAADVGPDVREAVAVLRGTKGNEAITGVVHFTDTGSGVHVIADIDGLAAGSEHGFHVHEFGDVTDAEKALSTGGHYNPEHHEHGKPGEAMSHVGDMGNVKADDKGHAHADVTLPAATINGKNGILGRGVILHANADKFTQPVGDAGGRIASGVIGLAQVKK